jgi:hypothetical protein
MSRIRLHTVKFENYGSLTILGLTKRQILSCRDKAGDDEDLLGALVFRLGLSKNKRLWAMADTELISEFADRGDLVDRIATAILERSWPEAEL